MGGRKGVEEEKYNGKAEVGFTRNKAEDVTTTTLFVERGQQVERNREGAGGKGKDNKTKKKKERKEEGKKCLQRDKVKEEDKMETREVR